MNHRLIVYSCLALAIAFAAPRTCAALQPDPLSSGFLEPQSASDKAAQEEDSYSAAQDALNQGEYDDAVKGFDSVIKMHGRKADAAMYWEAYALNKTGNKAQALTRIADLRKGYPQSKYLRDAGALEVQIKGAAVNTSDLDEETRLIALNALMNSDPEKAVPLLEKVIRSNDSPKLKDRALFVLSQSNSGKAQQILLSLAKANNDPDLQKRAIRYIGMNGNSRNRGILKEIYTSSNDSSVKKAVFQGWLMSGDKEDVLAVAQQEKSPELRREAIRYLGMMGGRTELRQLYKQSTDAESKEELIKAMGIGGDADGIAELAKTEANPEVRLYAIKNLGIFGGHAASDMLVTLYNTHNDVESKEAVINALFLNGAGKQMVALARKETNPELKRALIKKMSLMSSPEITEYMMEILNK
ncbi:MAG TPA: HEAT repeat domain-containing protein [Candidatus Angelobacter sp.]|nr:HEAT repeat domain-containing protein [Candidatus Angelobacter sp.]